MRLLCWIACTCIAVAQAEIWPFRKEAPPQPQQTFPKLGDLVMFLRRGDRDAYDHLMRYLNVVVSENFGAILLSITMLWAVKRLLFPRKAPLINPDGKWVLITGCDSGFGQLTALELVSRGYGVVAACLTEQGCKELLQSSNESPLMRAVKCDVTNARDVEGLIVEASARSQGELWAVVNNAGVGLPGPVDLQALDNYRVSMDVMCLSAINITQQCLPMLKTSRGRVVNMTSCLGMIAGGHNAPYNCAKWALEAFSDSLRADMLPFGVKVSVVQPGIMKTNLTSTFAAQYSKVCLAGPAAVQAEYGPGFVAGFTAHLEEAMRTVGSDAAVVVEALVDAVSSSEPKLRYRPDPMARAFAWLRLLPDSVKDSIVTNDLVKQLARSLPHRPTLHVEHTQTVRGTPEQVLRAFVHFVWREGAGDKRVEVVQAGDDLGRGCLRLIAGRLQEELVDAKAGQWVSYRLLNLGWSTFPADEHGGRVVFKPRGDDETVVVWRVASRPKPCAGWLVRMRLNSVIPDLLDKLADHMEGSVKAGKC